MKAEALPVLRIVGMTLLSLAGAAGALFVAALAATSFTGTEIAMQIVRALLLIGGAL